MKRVSMKICTFVSVLFLGLVSFAQSGSKPAPAKAPAAATAQSATAQSATTQTATTQTPTTQTPTTQTKIDPAKEADIRRLLDVSGAKKIVMQTMASMTTSVRPVLASSLPPGEYREKLIDLFFAKFQSKADSAQLLDLAVPLYDKYFSQDEIKGLIRFYETPLGQKSLSVLPQLTSEMADLGRQWGEKAGRDSMQEVLTEHPEMQQALEAAGKAAQQKQM
jgi:uncharacterized protein